MIEELVKVRKNVRIKNRVVNNIRQNEDILSSGIDTLNSTYEIGRETYDVGLKIGHIIKKPLLKDKQSYKSYREKVHLRTRTEKIKKTSNKNIILNILRAKSNNAYFAIILCIVFLFVVLIVALSSVISSTIGSAGNVYPRINNEQATQLISIKEKLDRECSKKLTNNFSIIYEDGTENYNWKTVFAVVLGMCDNDITRALDNINTGEIQSWNGTYSQLINDAGNLHGVNPCLIAAIIKQESDFNANSVSEAGAVGLMQLMPATAAWLGCSNPFDPYQNVMAGTKYIKYLLDYYNNNMTLAIAAYNCGPGNVDRYGGVPPFSETQNYVVKVTQYYNQYSSGLMHVEEGSVTGTTGTIQSNNIIAKVYYEINKIISKNELKRVNIQNVLITLEATEEQKEFANSIYEADLWDEVFPPNTDYDFKITGEYNSNGNIPSAVTGTRRQVLEVAQSLLGLPYVWGGKCPASQTPTALDCSGYVAYCYEKATGYSDLQGGGTSFQKQICIPIGEEQALPGDIAFASPDPHHVLIYAGKVNGLNYFYHEANESTGCIYSTYSESVVFYRVPINFQD